MEASLVSSIILGSVGLLVTVIYSRHSTKLAHDQMMKELFADFNKRYNLLNNSLHEIETKYDTTEKLDKAPNSFALKQSVQDYFNLCAEEFYWYRHKRRIDKIIWDSWQSGMLYWYHVPAIKDMWQSEIAESGKASYYITDGREFFVKL
jgi:hypothetical protein